MATIEELRANFTATFGSMTAGIRTIRQALQGIGQSSQESTQQANRAFKQFGSTLSKLQTEIKRTGSQGEFKDLNAAIAKAQTELKETGRVSEQSMKQLQQSVQTSKTKLGTLSDEGKRNLKTFEPVLKDVDRQIKQLGGNSNLKKLTSDQRIAVLQTKKLSEVVDIQSKRLSEENSRYKSLSSGILGTGSRTQQLKDKAEHLSNVLKIQGETVETLRRKYKDAVSTIGKDADETKRLESALNRTSSSMKITEADLKRANSHVAAQTTLWGRMNSRLSEAREKFQKLQDSGSRVAQTFGIATAIIGGGLGVTVKRAADFEQAMSNAESVMDPTDVKKYSGALENLAIVQGSKTAFSATQCAEAIGELQKAGVSTADIMHGALSGALNLATAGQINLKDAAEIASTALNAFRKDNLSVAQAANMLAGAANASATDVGELKLGLSQVSPVAAGVGWSFHDTVTALAEFSQYGLKGSDAGTSLKTMLQNLQPQTKAQTREMEKLGLITKNGNNQFIDAKGHFKGLSAISGILRKSLSGLSDAQRSAALEIMFGSDAVRAGNILYQAGAKGIDNMAKSMDKIKASDVAKKRLDNLKGTLEQLRGSLETAAISVGKEMTPALKSLIAWIQRTVDWFNHLSPEMKRMIVNAALTAAGITGLATVFGGFFAVVGGGLNGVATLIGLFSKITGPLRIMRTATTGATAATAALGGAQAATAAAGSGLLGILGPIALGIGAVTAAIGAGVLIHKLYQAHLASTDRALKKGLDSSQKFGSGVSKGTQRAASGFANLREKAHLEMDKLSTSTASEAKGISQKVVNAYGDMADQAIAKLQGLKKRSNSVFASIFSGTGTEGQEEQKDTTKYADQVVNKHIARIRQAEKVINELSKKYHGDLSQMSNDDFARLQKAQQYLDGQVSVFAKSYNEQRAMMSSWAVQSGHISYSTYQKQYTDAKKSYSQSLKAAQKFHDQRLKDLRAAHDNYLIDDETYNELMAKNDADLIANKAKAKDEFIRINKAMADNVKVTGDVYLKNGKTMQDSYRQYSDGFGHVIMGYEDLKTHQLESAEEWKKNTEKYNEELLHSDQDTFSMRSKAAKNYQKQMTHVYEDMGLSASEAKQQAKRDTEDLVNSMSKAGSRTAALSKEIGDKFIAGLKKADTKSIAKKWGIDLTAKLDLGKYGIKTGKQFIDAIKKGGADAFPMLREYFRDQLDSMSKKMDLSKSGSQAVKTLKLGLESGALTLKELKNKFGNQIYNLFPKSLKDIGSGEMKTLEDGLKNHSLSSRTLKKKYSNQLKGIYKQSLSSMGKDSLRTLQNALALGITNEKTLSRNYDKQLKKIYDKSLSGMGRSDIETLAKGYKLGIPSVNKFFDWLKGRVKSGARVNIKGSGTYSMSSLLSAYKSGKISTSKFMDALARMIKDKTNLKLTKEGKSTGQSYADALESKRKKTQEAADKHARDVITKLAIKGTTGKEGSSAGKSFADNLNTVKKFTSRAAKGHADTTKSNLSISKQTRGLGKKAGTSFGEGLGGTSGGVKKKSHDVGKSGLGPLASAGNAVIKVINNVLKAVGAPKSFRIHWKVEIPGFRRGVRNFAGGLALVSDALTPHKRELVHTPKGETYLTPDKQPALVNLPKGSSVIPNPLTEKILSGEMVPHFADGWNIPGMIKTGLDRVKGFTEMVFNGITHPVKMLKSLLDQTISIQNMPIAIGGNIAGMLKRVENSASKWLTDKLGGAGNPAGSGVQRWKPYVIRALAMTGLPTTAQYINAWLRQIATESGGNPRAMQHGYTDINSIKGDLAKGLLQTISSTFNAFKMPGFGNIWNGFHDMLAAMRYAISRYGKKGMLAVIGHGHGYKTGGWNLAHTLAELSEDNKAEVVLPVESNKNRTLDLISQVLGLYGGNKQGTASNVTPSADQVVKILYSQNQLIKEFMALVDAKPTGITEQQIYSANKKISNQYARLNKLVGRPTI